MLWCRVKRASLLTPWLVLALCFESLSEMEKLSYLFSLQPVEKIWQRIWGGKITCHWNLPQGHKMDCVKCQPELSCTTNSVELQPEKIAL